MSCYHLHWHSKPFNVSYQNYSAASITKHRLSEAQHGLRRRVEWLGLTLLLCRQKKFLSQDEEAKYLIFGFVLYELHAYQQTEVHRCTIDNNIRTWRVAIF